MRRGLRPVSGMVVGVVMAWGAMGWGAPKDGATAEKKMSLSLQNIRLSSALGMLERQFDCRTENPTGVDIPVSLSCDESTLAEICHLLSESLRASGLRMEVSEDGRVVRVGSVDFSGGSPAVHSPRAVSWGWTWDPKRTVPVVLSVRPGSPAAVGKILVGDEVVKVEKEKVSTGRAVDERVARYAPGQRIQLMVKRKTKAVELWLVVPE